MQENWTEKIFCRNHEGRDLFFIELSYDWELNYVFFNTSLDYNLSSISETKIIIEKIENNQISYEERCYLIEQLFILIQYIPDISSKYFNEDYLDRNGHFMEFYANVTNELLFKKNFNSYSVFSPTVNSFYFFQIKENLESSVKSEYLISKENFEELIINHVEIQLQYVDYFSESLIFYCVPGLDDNIPYELYLIMANNHLLMFFYLNKG